MVGDYHGWADLIAPTPYNDVARQLLAQQATPASHGLSGVLGGAGTGASSGTISQLLLEQQSQMLRQQAIARKEQEAAQLFGQIRGISPAKVPEFPMNKSKFFYRINKKVRVDEGSQFDDPIDQLRMKVYDWIYN